VLRVGDLALDVPCCLRRRGITTSSHVATSSTCTCTGCVKRSTRVFRIR
jgi:hypothetical protein